MNGTSTRDYRRDGLLIFVGGAVISAVLYFARTIGADTVRNHYLRWVIACIPAFLIIGIPEYGRGSPLAMLALPIGAGIAAGLALATFFKRH